MTIQPLWRTSRFHNFAAAMVVPVALYSVLAVLGSSDIELYSYRRDWLPIYVAASVSAGLVFMARAIGYYCIVVALIYVPAFVWLLPRFGQFVGRLVSGS